MIFDITAKPLLDRYRQARIAEAAVIEALHAAMLAKPIDKKAIADLTEDLTRTNNAAMDLWDELQQIALGE